MLAGKTAVELVRMVRAGEATPVQIVGAHLERVAALDGRIGVADPPYSVVTANALLARWAASVAEEARDVDRDFPARRTRGHIAMGRLVRRRGWVKAEQRERWTKRAEEFFTNFDILLTPACTDRKDNAVADPRSHPRRAITLMGETNV